ncbi:MAG: methyl-accepting chemotaxis protein [Desulforhopalus sp.]|jgi:methyl-accepting chemotaxis protein
MQNTLKKKKNVRTFSIALKTSASCGVFIFLLLSLNTIVSNILEQRLVSSIFSQYSQEVESIIDRQGQVRQEELRSVVATNIEMLAGAAATLLYNFDTVSMERLLTGYVKLPSIVAVETLDDADKPFFAIWKNPDVQTADGFPADLQLNRDLSVTQESNVKDEKVGRVTIYYTDKALLSAMENDKIDSRTRIVSFEKTVDKSMAHSTIIQITIAIVVVILLIVAIIVVLNLLAIRPLKVLTAMVTDLVQGEGDLTKRLNLTSRDELGALAGVFNLFIERMQSLLLEISGNAQTLNSASSNMSTVAESMSTGSESMSAKAKETSEAANQLSSQMNSVAAASEEAATNVSMVAAATEEMTATVNEIAKTSEKARTVTSEAVQKAKNASNQVDELGNAAQEISKVTEVITEISEQTNLLALNATIEAARAGEAGRGFAVVANEIKELAKQTANATQDIKTRIEGMQKSTHTTVAEIEQITQVIHIVNELVATIATAVEEQAVTTQEIANNVAQASTGIAEVNERVADNSNVSNEIADSINQVDDVASDMRANSSKVSDNSSDLLKLASQLNDMISRFKI